jgi:hypothetical protein
MPVQRNFWMIGLSVAGGTLLCCAIAVLVALFGLGQIGSHTDLTALPAWLWYYRADPLLILWLKRGAGGRSCGRAPRNRDPAPRPIIARHRAVCAKARSGGRAFAPLPASLSAAKLDVS